MDHYTQSRQSTEIRQQTRVVLCLAECRQTRKFGHQRANTGKDPLQGADGKQAATLLGVAHDERVAL